MGLQIVYIDDEQMLCEIFDEMISNENYKVFTFTNADKAKEFILHNKVDVIFLDYRLYNITGDELAQQIDIKIPKILITGDVLVVTQYKFVKTLQKPVNYKEIREYLENFKKQQ